MSEAPAMAAPGSAMMAEEFPWWVVLIQGLFAALIGILLITNPAATSIVLVQIVGWYWLISGIIGIVLMFMDHTMWGWKLFLGALGIFAGLAVIQAPLWSTWLVLSVLVIYLGLSGIIMGGVNLLLAFKGAGWGTGILGLLHLLLGAWLLAYRIEATLLYPWVSGIVTLTLGAIAVFLSFQVKKAQEA